MRCLRRLSAGILFLAAVFAQTPEEALLDQYCAGCHNAKVKSGGLVLDGLDPNHPGDHPETWEKVVR